MRFLLDEMFPPHAAELLRDAGEHPARHVGEVGLGAASGAAAAAIVTGNVADVTRRSMSSR